MDAPTAFPRYAVYFVPEPASDLYRFGAAALGYDCFTGAEVDYPPDIPRDTTEWAELTREPRTYGFHATLKAPFRLRSGFDEGEVERRLGAFAASTRSVPVIVPAVRMVDSFIAIVPRATSAGLSQLAADCVTAFDPLRAPMTPQDRARRMAANLSERQIAHLDSWGYPYVFDDFRFHMTLTGRIDPARAGPIVKYLEEKVAALAHDRPIAIDHLALVRQDCAGARFRVACHVAIGAAR